LWTVPELVFEKKELISVLLELLVSARDQITNMICDEDTGQTLKQVSDTTLCQKSFVGGPIIKANQVGNPVPVGVTIVLSQGFSLHKGSLVLHLE